MKKSILLFWLSAVCMMVMPVLAQDSGGNNVSISFNPEKNEIKIKGKEQDIRAAAWMMTGVFCENEKVVNFKVGNQIFSAPKDDLIFLSMLVKETSFTFNKDESDVELVMPKNLGCPENPDEYAFVQIKSNGELFTVAERSQMREVSDYILHLNKSNLCFPAPMPGVALCAGSKSPNGTKIFVAFFIPLNEAGGMTMRKPFDYPVHAYCQGTDEKNLFCTVDEYFAKNFKVSLPISFSELGKEKILQKQQALMAMTKKLVVNGN